MERLQLRSLRLLNFRCFKDSTISFDQRVTFIVGPNRTGKSTVGDAIEFVTSGRCVRGTDAAGKGAKALVRDYGKPEAAKGFSLEATFTNGPRLVELARHVNANGTGQVEGHPLPITPALLRILVHGTALLDPKITPEAEATKVLMDALDVRVPIGGEKLSIARVVALYDQAYAERRDANREVERIYVPALPEGDPPPDDLELRVAQLRAHEQELVVQQRETTATDKGRAAELRRQLATAEEKTRVTRERLAAAKCPEDVDAQIAALEQALKMNSYDDKAVAVQEALLADLAHQVAPIEHEAQRLELMASRTGEERKCGYSDSIPCKTPAKLFVATHGARRDQLAALSGQVEAGKVQLADLRAAVASRVDQEKQLVELKTAVVKRSREQLACNEATAAEKKLREDLAAAESQPTESATENQALAQVRAKLERAQDLLVKAAAYRTLVTEHEQRTREKADAMKRAADLDAQVQTLGPDGARKVALEQAVGAFEDDVAEYLETFGYESFKFRLDPWAVLVNGVPAVQLSETEQIRAGIALQMAVADLTGLGLVVIDRVDHFDKATRQEFAQLVQEWSGQVVVLMTRDEDDKVPGGPGVAVYRLQRDLERMGPSEAVRVAGAA